jgi:hypothetical protein
MAGFDPESDELSGQKKSPRTLIYFCLEGVFGL